MSTAQNPAQAALDAYAAAVYAKDVDAFCALYADDVHIFDMWGQWSHEGIAARRAMATGWFGSLGTERVVVGVQELQCWQSGDLLTAHGYQTFAAVSAEGEQQRSMVNRLSLVMKKIGPVWKIVHQHTSAPADFATAKVMFERPAHIA